MRTAELGPLALSRWQGLRAFTATELRVQLHEGPALATSMVVQVIFLVFVKLLAPPNYLPFALIGAVIFSVFTLGERVQNEAAYIRLDHKLHEFYHASPLSPESYFLGMSTGILLAYLPPVLFLTAVMEVIHPLTAGAAGVLVLVLLGLWLFASSVGYIVSTFFHDMRTIWPYATLFYNLFGVLPPVFYPLFVLPAPSWWAALVIPPSGAAALVDWAEGILSLSEGQVALAAGTLALVTGSLLLLGLHWARRTAQER
jgi:ABC-2 type transport system permease protein